MMWSLVGGFVVAMVAWGYYETREMGEGTRTVSHVPWSNSFPWSSSFIGNITISDIAGQWKYVFTYEWNQYLLYSKKEYVIGDHVWLVGSIQNNMHPDGFSYRKISASTFDVPIFSWGFDYNKWLKMKGRHWTIYETNSLVMNGGGWRVENWEVEINPSTRRGGSPSLWQGRNIGYIQSIKKSIQEQIISVYGKNKVSGLILGMVIGDKSQIPASEYQSFIDSWLVHLVAVSGGNILMIVVFLHFLLFFLPYYIRLGVVILTIIGYGLVCGMDSSVFRAVIMGGMSTIALFWGREIDVRRLLSRSAIIMLVINPYFLAYDSGFLLSYTALIGIMYFTTWKDGKVETWKNDKNIAIKWLQYIYKNYLSPSIWASIGIFPIIIFFMGKINLMSIIGNLLVLPVVPFVMIYGYVSTWLYALLWRNRVLRSEIFLIQYIYQISDLFSRYGIYFMVTGLRFKYVVLTGFIVVFLLRRRKSQERDGETSKQSTSAIKIN